MKPILLTTTMSLLFASAVSGIAHAELKNESNAASADSAAVERLITQWPNRPKLGAREMIVKYGLPQEASSEKLVWNNAGPYRRIMVTREEIPHDFPKPHMDFLEHTIEYNVPLDKIEDLIEFDGSSTINRTAGELSARCDLEGHNILTLNLNHDIVTGKKSVKEARTAFGEEIVKDQLGEHPPYVEALQFQPTGKSARFPDEPVIPGSPVRTMKLETGKDAATAEVLAFVIAADDNEILAAAKAGKKKMSGDAAAYAKMLHIEHGKNQAATMKLGMKLDIVPTDTPAVDALRVKGAGGLAALTTLKGEKFEKAYLAAMVKGHEEVLEMIDNKLMKMTDDEEVRKQLTETRSHVVAHLEQGKRLQKM